ncbi:MAG: hypothetical protein ACI8Y4_000119 [Candidatus Poriferisodalaceae bacterium]|jgi:hypothetical protein
MSEVGTANWDPSTDSSDGPSISTGVAARVTATMQPKANLRNETRILPVAVP